MSEGPLSRHLLFLPGAGADPNFWKPVGERMPAAWASTYLRWPGIGHNPPDAQVQTFEELVSLAERRLLDLTRSGAAVDVLAHSMGGAIALDLALRQKASIRRLVLMVTSGGLPVEAFGASDWRPGYRVEYPNAAEWLYAARPDHTSRLHEVTQPTLLIWGDSDPISPPAVGKEFERRMPNASLVVLPGGTHALAFERPDEVAALIRGHLGGDSHAE
jgi:pimeloyl-ACP methyl ester carboxylesterase